MKKLGIIHTTPVTVESLKQLVAEIIPDCKTINIMDDTILPELNNGASITDVKPRWKQYANVLASQGADLVLSACSSVGGLVDIVQENVPIPLVRIDEAMAEYAIKHARKIGIAATLSTTLEPTISLLEKKAKEKGKEIEIIHKVASLAYQKLIAGDKEGHDKELVKMLNTLLAKDTELIVLAQASMARVVSLLPEEKQTQFLTSPILGINAVKEKLYQ